MIHLGGLLDKLVEPLLKNDLVLMKNVFKPLTKIALIRFQFPAAATSATDAAI